MGTTVPIFILELALPTNQETLFLLTLKSDKEKSIEDCCLQLKLGTQCGQDIKPRILTSAELFMIGSDPDWDLKHQLRTTENNKEETGAVYTPLDRRRKMAKIGIFQ